MLIDDIICQNWYFSIIIKLLYIHKHKFFTIFAIPRMHTNKWKMGQRSYILSSFVDFIFSYFSYVYAVRLVGYIVHSYIAHMLHIWHTRLYSFKLLAIIFFIIFVLCCRQKLLFKQFMFWANFCTLYITSHSHMNRFPR